MKHDIKEIGAIINKIDFNDKIGDCSIHGKDVLFLLDGSQCLECFEIERDKLLKEEMQSHIKKRVDLLDNQLLTQQKNAEIPPRFYDARIENFIVRDAVQKSIIEKLKDYDYTKNLLLLGKTGNGKTHLACAIGTNALIQGKTVFYSTYTDLTELKIHDRERFREVALYDVFIIDEYGLAQTDWKSTLLADIVNKRYSHLLQTIIIGNTEEAVFENSLLDSLKSRLLNNTIKLVFSSEDYRNKKRK